MPPGPPTPAHLQVVARQRSVITGVTRSQRHKQRRQSRESAAVRAWAATRCSASRPATGSRFSTMLGFARPGRAAPDRHDRRRSEDDHAGDHPRRGFPPVPIRSTRIRRWDQSGKVSRQDGITVWWDIDAQGSAEFPCPHGTSLILESGITVSFDLSARQRHFLPATSGRSPRALRRVRWKSWTKAAAARHSSSLRALVDRHLSPLRRPGLPHRVAPPSTGASECGCCCTVRRRRWREHLRQVHLHQRRHQRAAGERRRGLHPPGTVSREVLIESARERRSAGLRMADAHRFSSAEATAAPGIDAPALTRPLRPRSDSWNYDFRRGHHHLAIAACEVALLRRGSGGK